MSLWGRFGLAVVVLLSLGGFRARLRGWVVGEKAPELKAGEWLLQYLDALSDSRPTLVEFFFSL